MGQLVYITLLIAPPSEHNGPMGEFRIVQRFTYEKECQGEESVRTLGGMSRTVRFIIATNEQSPVSLPPFTVSCKNPLFEIIFTRKAPLILSLARMWVPIRNTSICLDRIDSDERVQEWHNTSLQCWREVPSQCLWPPYQTSWSPPSPPW